MVGMPLDSTLWISIRVVVCCIAFAYFVFVPFKTKFRYSYTVTAALTGFLVVYTVLVTVLFLTPGGRFADYSTWGILLWIGMALLFFCVAIKGSYFEILFIVLVVLNLYVNIMAIAKVLAGELVIPEYRDFMKNVMGMLVLALYLPFLKKLTKLYQQVVEINIRLSFWRSIWIIPTLTYLIFFVKIIQDYWKKETDMELADVVFVILWSFSTYVFFYVTLQMISQTYRGITATEEAHMVSSHLRMQEEQYEKLLRNLEKNARLRHDWRHHLLLLDGFADRGDMDGVKGYLRQMIPVYSTEGELSVCENHAVDVILRHWAAIAKSEGVRMDLRLRIPKELFVSDMDLCIIFGNLAENAMEACKMQKEGERYIEIRAEVKGRQLIAAFRNSCSNPVIEKDGVYYSTKHEGPGIGLSSVKRVAEKYSGLVKINYKKKEFCASVLLNGPQE